MILEQYNIQKTVESYATRLLMPKARNGDRNAVLKTSKGNGRIFSQKEVESYEIPPYRARNK